MPYAKTCAQYFSRKKSIAIGNELIKWEYIDLLHKLQSNEGLHLSNKLRSSHILFKKTKRMLG